MKFNTKTRYGLRTMIELAMHFKNGPFFQKDIALNQELSDKYLDHIIADLKKAGLVKNAGGKKSGYVLTREPNKIFVYDIFIAFNSNKINVDCVDADEHCNRKKSCAANEFWIDLNNYVCTYLKSISLEKLVKKQHILNQ